MKRVLFITLAIWMLILGTPLAQGETPTDETRFTLRQEFLRLINHDRQEHGLAPVVLDVDASILADNYCRRQIRNGTTGHFTIDGQSPYMRYSFAGGNDGLSENAAAWSANYNFSDRALYEMMRNSEEAMMAETEPHDGHRRTILDPHATHVGIGLAWEKGEFRIAQEFIRRYVDWTDPLPRAASAGEHILCSGKPRPGFSIDAISVYHEPTPQPISPITANLIRTYSLPDGRHDYLPRLHTHYQKDDTGVLRVLREQYLDGSQGDFPLSDDGSFTFDVPFAHGPGVYTIVVWVRTKAGGDAPIAASNVSIRVEQPSTRVGALSSR